MIRGSTKARIGVKARATASVKGSNQYFQDNNAVDVRKGLINM
jgi:hypothetical protein